MGVTSPRKNVPASYWDVPMVTAKARPLIDARSGRILGAALTKIGQEKTRPAAR
jgi:hypothetical protein